MTPLELFYPDEIQGRFWGGYGKFFEPALSSKHGTQFMALVRIALRGGQRDELIEFLSKTHTKLYNPGGRPPVPTVCFPTDQAALAIKLLKESPMRFTAEQYQKAIQRLKDASEQLEPDGRCCACCGDDGHQAFECGFNPLVAMDLCKEITAMGLRVHDEIHLGRKIPQEKTHEILHWLAGYDHRMGQPRKVRMP